MEMLEVIGWDTGMSGLAALLLIVGALLLGAVPQLIGESKFGVFEWLITSVAVLVGGWLGSEAFGEYSTWGYAFEGLYVWPALIGGVVLGVITDVIVRFSTGGTYTHEPRPV